jgi:8-oxo-dGTP pyrophosphatase MutT (NUDIX family)
MIRSSPTLSALEIRSRLRHTAPAGDPRVVTAGVGRNWPPALQRRMTADLKPAGVLIPIIDRPGGLSVLLTRRSQALKHHAGQVSFPGGSMETGDVDIRHTALRETHEEVGIEPGLIDVAGYLAPMPTITGYAVTPVVGLLAADVRLTLDTTEVESAFEVPLPFLLDTDNERWSERDIEGVPVPIVEFRYGGHRIWGATAFMNVTLRDYLI